MNGRKWTSSSQQKATPIRQPSSAVRTTTEREPGFGAIKEILPEDITVAIFCALPCESVAVKYSLDEEFSCRWRASGSQKHAYSFGRIGDIKVVIAQPQHVGTVGAAHCASAVIQQFPNIRYSLSVGIGTGIPNLPGHDIRLGDVAVSIPQDNHPGVVQYDFGKYEKDGFVPKGCLNKPPSILISADGVTEEDKLMNRSSLIRILRKIEKEPRFSRPDTMDVLFEQDFQHANANIDCSGCKASSKNKVVSRTLRDNRYPVVHRGLILSGSGIITDPSDRKRLLRNNGGAICYETQAAGIMDEIPCLVIRGIYEYADTHKQDGWHHYAAAVAAAHCKAILCKIDSQSPRKMRSA